MALFRRARHPGAGAAFVPFLLPGAYEEHLRPAHGGV